MVSAQEKGIGDWGAISKNARQLARDLQGVVASMLWRIRQLTDFMLRGTENGVGILDSMAIDLHSWKVLALIVWPGKWLPRQRVRLDIAKVREIDRLGIVHLNLSGDALRQETPVAVQAPGQRGGEAFPVIINSKDFLGWQVHAEGGGAGRIDDLLLDDTDWSIRYLVVDIHPLLPGKRVLLAPTHVVFCDWQKRHLMVDLSRHMIRHAPSYHSMQSIDKSYEEELASYYAGKGASP